jgi:hypothetical protein
MGQTVFFKDVAMLGLIHMQPASTICRTEHMLLFTPSHDMMKEDR